jgi:parvulin-like peptidyl-prolyl isomerase
MALPDWKSRKEFDVNKLILAAGFVALLMPWGCSSGGDKTEEGQTAAAKEPDYVKVQHVLIGFKGSVPGKAIQRTRDVAEVTAEDILKRALEGEDFDMLVKQYTDDAYPGIYAMANVGVAPKTGVQMFQRERMVKGFGDVAFSLEVGGVGMTPYDPQDSEYGWHIIKRVE